MTLLAPWALWFAAVGAAVVALYLLKIKRRQQTVPALDFWRELAGRTKVHSLFQRLKRLLSMLLWLLIAACLVLALGNPILSLGRIKPRAIAVIIDNSASMQTLEAGEQTKSRLELAREALHELTTRRPVSDQWLLIEAARQPRVLQSWTYDSKTLRQAAGALTPFHGSGDISAAVNLASALLEGKPDPCIVVISDGAAGGWGSGGGIEPLAENDARIVHWSVGETSNNLGIVRLSVRRHRQHSNYHVLVSVVNASDEAIESPLTLEIDGVTTSVELMNVEGAPALRAGSPGGAGSESRGTWEKVVVIDAPASTSGQSVLRVSIDREDALALDNEAFAVLEPIRPAIVWLVTDPEEAFFFEQALGAMESLVWPEESVTITIDEYERLASLRRAPDPENQDAPGTAMQPAESPTVALQSPDLIVFNNVAPSKLPESGRLIMVNAWPAEIPATDNGAEPLAAPQLFLSPRPHAITQYLHLQGARLTKARRVTLTDRATVLAHSADGDPLMFVCEPSSGRDVQALCLAFDVHDSDLPFRNAFPLLLRNAVAFMHSEAPSWIHSQYRIGETIAPLRPLPLHVQEVEVTIQGSAALSGSPAHGGTGVPPVRNSRTGGTPVPPPALTPGSESRGTDQQAVIPVHNARFTCDATERNSVVQLTFGGETCAAAVNLADAGESQLAPDVPKRDPAEALMLSRRLLGAMPWIGFAIAAAGLIALEWLTFNFRWTE